ncbi:putative quinol monooxygenase [Lichenicoccus sp.]|uniref:putative quinol monooxygenase n=1 Tax=Lichenicoccus sp. TaxID=2781899 RepID=UPI003D10F9A2
MTSITTPFTVIAELEVAPELKAEFLEICRMDGAGSVTNEPGCRQFDTLTSEETPNAVILYEVYDDRAAFDHHLTTPHYKVFAAAVEKLGVQTRLVRFLARAHP